MSNFIPLDSIQVASPCQADWNAMSGDEQARFCQSCHKHVYNLSEMTRDEAQQLILEKEGKLCVRFYQRADGTLITNNCPVGLAAESVPTRSMWNRVGAMMVAGCAAVLGIFGVSMASQAHQPVPPRAVMGKIAMPKPTPVPTPQPTAPSTQPTKTSQHHS